MELSKDCIEIKNLCDKGKVWAKKTGNSNEDYLKRGFIFLFEKTLLGKYKANTGELLE